MPTRKFLKQLTTALLLIQSVHSYATHGESADLTYRCLGGNQYQFTLSFYRDCCPTCAAASGSVTIRVTSASCGQNFNITLNPIPGTGIEVSPLCATASSQCSNPASPNPGVQQYIYRGTVTLPAACNDWVFGFTQCCRNCAITTITNPCSSSGPATNVYVEAKLNNLNFPCNNSPVFSTLPIPFVCVGQSYCFSHGATDADGDSLSYSLITPKTTAALTVNYIAPNTATQPLTSVPAVTFNSATGDICMTPTLLERTVMAVLVQEWRNGQLVGSVIRDMQVAVFPCSNNTPFLTGINGTGVYNQTVCFPDTVSFQVPTLDKDTIPNVAFIPTFQNTIVSWNNGISGASFTTSARFAPSGSSLAIGTFTWVPTPSDISTTPHCFVAQVQDNNCPIYATELRSYCITVLGASVNSTVPQTICANNPSTLLTGTVYPASSSVNWSGGAGTYNPNNTTLTTTYSLSPAEVNSGQATLSLSSSGTGSCGVYTSTIAINCVSMGTVSVSSNNLSCNGLSNGTATVSVSGGAAPFTYSWSTSPAKTTAAVTGLSPGTYTVTVGNAYGCITTKTVSISQPVALTTSTAQNNVSCFLGTNGTASVTGFGGTPAYSYSWSPGGATTSSISNLAQGVYTVTVRDANLCVASNTVSITQPSIINATINNIVHVSCKGGSDGSARVSASGGTSPYNYSWSPMGGSSPTAVNLEANPAYVVVVTDANGCQGSANAAINEPATAVTSTVTTSNTSCSGGSNGSASVAASGGTPGYTYLWSPVGTTNLTATGLSATNYTITVTDTKGCQEQKIVTVGEPLPLTLTTNTVSSTCGLADGQANVEVSGGTANYSYLWSNGATTPGISNIIAGIYTATVTDANGCIESASATIPNTNPPVTSSMGPAVNATCNGISNGSAVVIPSTGTGPFTYLWSPSGGITATGTNLAAGTYTVTINDNTNCQATNTVTITQPPAISLVISNGTATCGNPTGQASVIASGGNPGYTYLWSPGGAVTETATALASGAYSVTVTDLSGCTQLGLAFVSDLSGPVITSFTVTNTSCFGGSDGSATVFVTGGSSPYEYSWNTIPIQTAVTATGLSAGSYVATVTDAIGCVGIASTNPVVGQPTAIALSTSRTNVSCKSGNDGTANVSASGGTPGYTYSWMPGGATTTSITNLIAGAYTVTATDLNSCTAFSIVTVTEPAAALTATVTGTNVKCYGGNSGAATINASGGTLLISYNWLPYGGNSANAIGLTAGSYTAIATDSKGCVFIPAPITITQPATPLTSSTTKTNVSCFGGSNGTATVTATGGTPGYTYSWLPVVSASSTIGGLSIGHYNITVTDLNLCQSFSSAIITQPPFLNVSTTNEDNSYCNLNNGQASTLVSGGVAPYTFLWLPGGTTNITATGLSANSYTVTVTDRNNCSAFATTSLIDTPGGTASTTVPKNVSCFGGSDGTASVSMQDGVAPFAYSWAPTGGINATATNLAAGSYTVTVTDKKGCATTATATVSEPPILTPVIIAVTDVSCNGGNNGSATASATGGTQPYLYAWTITPAQNNSLANNLAAGTYEVIVSDFLGCSTAINATISEPPVLTPTITIYSDVSCFGDNDGTATVTSSGGTSPYFYLWNTVPAQITQTASGLSIGTHTVTVTDLNGCSARANVIIGQPMPVITIASNDTTICFGQIAIIVADASGGNGGYSYLWDQGLGYGNNIIVEDSITTQYIVTAYDSKECVGTTDSTTVNVIILTPENLIVNGTTPICPGTSTSISANVTGTAGTPTYNWNNGLPAGEGPHVVSPLVPTTYIVTASNSCGVIVEDSITITLKALPTAIPYFNTSTGCTPLLVQFTDSSVSVNPIVSWLWNFGEGNTSVLENPSHIYNQAGTYIVSLKVTTSEQCENTSPNNDTVVALPTPVPICSASSYDAFIGTDISFFNSSTGGTESFWNFGDNTTSSQTNPVHSYEKIGTYQVSLITSNQYGCSDTCILSITIKSDIVFPTIFTPGNGNNDGSYNINSLDNDIFFAYTQGVIEFSFEVFNRWGELLFETKDINKGWNGYYKGKICEQDVYVWKASGEFNDGRKFKKTGNVMLLR